MQFIKENTKENGRIKYYFDIDETLFAHDNNMLKIYVKDENGNRLFSLNNQEYNDYVLKEGQSFDYGDFRCPDVFKKSAKPIHQMIKKMKEFKESGANVEMLTARADFNNKEKFIEVMNDHGIDITPGKGIHVRRAGNRPGKTAEVKAIHISEAIHNENLTEVHLYDDSISNINGVLELCEKFPDVTFHCHHVMYDLTKDKVIINTYSRGSGE